MGKFVCPICGCGHLKEAPFGLNNEPSFEICPDCGFEFGFDGNNDPAVLDEYRQRWIKNGRKKL